MVKNNDLIVSRAAAIIIDSIILIVVGAVLAFPLGLQSVFMGGMNADFMLAAMWGSFGILMFVIGLAYFTYFEGTTGQTVGKRVMNIKVVREDKKPMTYMDAFIRTLLRIIDGQLIYILGLIIILISEKGQRLGDMAAKTLVVKA